MEENKHVSVFETLRAINVNEHTEKKGRLTYLSWAWAWDEVKKHYPEAFYTIYENANGLFYHTDGKTCWVKTGLTIKGIEHIEYLPVMDNFNKSIPVDKVTSFDVNTAIQRSLTKAAARHGLGLYIYAGEDLPEDTDASSKPKSSTKTAPKPADAVNPTRFNNLTPEQFKEVWVSPQGSEITMDDIADLAKAWGLYSVPRTVEMETVKRAVLKKAGLVPDNATDEYFILINANSKEALRKMLITNHWTGNKELVAFAQELATNLPEE